MANFDPADDEDDLVHETPMEAHVNRDSACVPYQETLENRMIRYAGYFQDFTSWYAVDPMKELPVNEALRLYGLGNQAKDGDVQGPVPSITQVEDRLKYNAWYAERGKSRQKAARQFIRFATKLMTRLGKDQSDWHEPEERKKYDHCVEKLLASGKSIESIKWEQEQMHNKTGEMFLADDLYDDDSASLLKHSILTTATLATLVAATVY